MNIYVKFGKQKTVREFLKKMFSYENYNGFRQNVTTYFDEECTNVQCIANKYRSFDDIFDCVKTYYKGITPKMLIHTLLTLDIKNSKEKPLYFHMGNCSSIRRIRMLYYTIQESSYQYFACNKYDSKYSWAELLEMLGIKTTEDIINYYNKYKK